MAAIVEPRIQYARTSDGVNIAYWTLGEGMPLVCMPFLALSHIRMEWQRPQVRSFYERLAKRCKVVRYDCRGAGLSDRSVADYSIDGLTLDMEAVVDRLGLESFALFAPARSGPVAITYAASHPAQVSHLLLWGSSPRCVDLTPPASTAREHALRTLREQDWELYTETIALVRYGWSRAGEAQQMAELIREASSAEAWGGFEDALADVDVTARLHEVKARTLVMHRRKHPFLSLDVARGLAGDIPNAQLALLEGESGMPWGGDVEEVLRAIDEFLGERDEAQAAPELPSGTAVILFADIADSTGLTERLGDAAFRAKARELGGSLRTLIRECGGTAVEGPTLGDGVLAAFTSAREAIEAALACASAGSHAGLPLHVGIHAGDVMREKDPDGRDNVYGGAVNIAARISGLSAPGEVLVSDTVRGLARTSAGVTFEDRGEHELKGVADAQRLFTVRAR